MSSDKGGSWDVGFLCKHGAWGCWQEKGYQSALVIQMDQESLHLEKRTQINTISSLPYYSDKQRIRNLSQDKATHKINKYCDGFMFKLPTASFVQRIGLSLCSYHIGWVVGKRKVVIEISWVFLFAGIAILILTYFGQLGVLVPL